MRIQHNIMAMNAYRNYTTNTSAMQKNLERLSSGFKINRAGDDAAGLAISEKMRAQITGLEVAQKNAKDGISLVQTAEGALTEVHDMLNRMVELASQSANGTYSNDTDRVQLQKELDQLRAEIDRIADSANFNGIQLLDGNMDAGGDTVYTKGLFQFDDSTLHPTGIGDNGKLPPLAKEGEEAIRGTNTILHTEGTAGGDKNMFSVDFENLQIKAGGKIDIKIGNNLTITVENLDTTKGVDADAIVSAIAAGGKDGAIGVTFTVGGEEVSLGDNEAGTAKTITLGEDSVFEISANGSRLTFTQIDGADITMPQNVLITSNTTTYEWGNLTEGTGNFATDIELTASGGLEGIDLSLTNNGTAVEALADSNGALKVKVGDVEFTIKLVQGEEAEDTDLDVTGLNGSTLKTALEGKIKELYNARLTAPTKDGETNENAMGTVTIALDTSNKIDGTETVGAKEATVTSAEAPPTIKYDSGEPEPDDITITVKDSSSAAVDWKSTGNADSKLPAIEFEIGGQTYSISWVGNSGGTTDPADGKISYADLGSSAAYNKLAEGIEAELKEMIKAKMEELAGEGEPFTYVDGDKIKLTFGNDGTIKVEFETIAKTPSEGAAAGETFSGDWNVGTTDIETKFEGSQDRLASTWIDLNKLAKDGVISEGTTITIGRDTYIFTYDKNKIGKDGYVVMNQGEDIKDTAVKLTEAAKKNSTYTVGHDKEGRITLLEKEDQTNFDLTTMEGIEKSLGFKIATTRATDTSKGLTLQIGDTAESYNQLKVNIKDCHVKALSLDQISIASQADAAEAVDAINDAINYVSDVRGTLGATQNRLDHTINNLSVMTENIQDAESTIRDTDIAEEMMAYTKNNILIQAAQAMLAQANQVPQGVLQLLQ